MNRWFALCLSCFVGLSAFSDSLELVRRLGTPLPVHTFKVTHLAFSKDNRWLVSGDSGGNLTLWDAENRTPYRTKAAEGKWGAIRSLQFSRRGQEEVLVTTYRNHFAAYRLPSLTEVALLAPQGAGPKSQLVEFADGKQVAWSDEKGVVHWGNRQWELGVPIEVLALSPDEKYLVAAGEQGKAISIDLNSGGRTVFWPETGERTTAVAFFPAADGSLQIALGRRSGRIDVHQQGKIRSVAWLAAEESGLTSLRYKPFVQELVALTDGYISRFSIHDLSRRAHKLEGVSYYPGGTGTFATDGNLMAFSNGRHVFFLDDGQNLPEKTQVARYSFDQGISGLAFTPDGSTLAIGDGTETIRLWNWGKAGGIEKISRPGRSLISELFFGPQNMLFVNTIGKVDEPNPGEIYLWREKKFWGAMPFVKGMGISTDGRVIGANYYQNWNDQGLRLYQGLLEQISEKTITAPALPSRLESFSYPEALRFSPVNSNLLLAGPMDLVLFDFGEVTPVKHKLSCNSGSIRDFVFSPDGKIIAIATSKGISNDICFIETASLTEVSRTVSNPNEKILFSPDGNFLAIGNWESRDSETPNRGEVELKPVGFETFYCIVDHGSRTRAFTFTPDGRFLVTGGQDATVAVWDYEKYYHHYATRFRFREAQDMLAREWAKLILPSDRVKDIYAAIFEFINYDPRGENFIPFLEKQLGTLPEDKLNDPRFASRLTYLLERLPRDRVVGILREISTRLSSTALGAEAKLSLARMDRFERLKHYNVPLSD